MKKSDVAIIGAGPGGYVAAIRLAQLGKKVLLIDRDKVGGVCLNYGCIPSKALISAANLYEQMTRSAEIGISCGSLSMDFSKLQSWKNQMVRQLTQGIGFLLKKNGVELLSGEASFFSPTKLRVQGANGEHEVEAQSYLLATGSQPVALPAFPFDGKKIIDSTAALELLEVPKELLILGGGVIGLEIGTFYAKLGVKVKVVELLDQLLPGIDPDLVAVVSRALKQRGVEIYLQAEAKKCDIQGEKITLHVKQKEKEFSLIGDVLLSVVGRKPNSSNLGLDKAGVEVDAKGFVKVNSCCRTNVPHISAIGDLIGPPFLAHKASKEGLIAAEVMVQGGEGISVRALPAAIFTDPEIASVGLSETEAKNKGIPFKVGKFPFAASGRALSSRHAEGFVKVIMDPESHQLLGVHIVGAEASNLISEATLAIEMGATAEDLALTVHPHPTLSEAVMEACESALGQAIHIYQTSS